MVLEVMSLVIALVVMYVLIVLFRSASGVGRGIILVLMAVDSAWFGTTVAALLATMSK